MGICATLTVTSTIPARDCSGTHHCDANCPDALTNECQSPNPCVANHCASGCPDAATCGLCGSVDSGAYDTSPTASRMTPGNPCYAFPVYDSDGKVVNKLCSGTNSCNAGCPLTLLCGQCPTSPACPPAADPAACIQDPCLAGCPYHCGCKSGDPCPIDCAATPCALTCPNATNCTTCPDYSGCQYVTPVTQITCDSTNCESPKICINNICMSSASVLYPATSSYVCDAVTCVSPGVCVNGVCTTESTSSASVLYSTSSATTTVITAPVITNTSSADIMSMIFANPSMLGLLAVGIVGIIVVGGKK